MRKTSTLPSNFSDLLTSLPNTNFIPSFLLSFAQLTPSPPLPVSLSLEDSELLSFYSSQSLAHLSCLADAIDVLFSSVQGNQPPRIFVARGKSLIVTAHKLVFIGDTLSRLLTSAGVRAKVCRENPDAHFVFMTLFVQNHVI